MILDWSPDLIVFQINEHNIYVQTFSLECSIWIEKIEHFEKQSVILILTIRIVYMVFLLIIFLMLIETMYLIALLNKKTFS